MEEILSKKNKKIVDFAKLKDKKYRKLSNKYIIEGIVMLKDAIRQNKSIDSIFVLKDDFGSIDYLKQFEKKYKIYLVSKEIIEYLSDTVTPQSVIAVLDIENNENLKMADRILILDCLQDPGNLGTIIRTCASVGIKQIYLINSVDAYNPKCIRSTKSGIFFVDIIETSYEKVIESCKENGIKIITTLFNGENIFEVKPEEKFALVIGNEANGISKTLEEAGEISYKIPMKNGMDSLNAGVSASIILYELLKNTF